MNTPKEIGQLAVAFVVVAVLVCLFGGLTPSPKNVGFIVGAIVAFMVCVMAVCRILAWANATKEDHDERRDDGSPFSQAKYIVAMLILGALFLLTFLYFFVWPLTQRGYQE